MIGILSEFIGILWFCRNLMCLIFLALFRLQNVTTMHRDSIGSIQKALWPVGFWKTCSLVFLAVELGAFVVRDSSGQALGAQVEEVETTCSRDASYRTALSLQGCRGAQGYCQGEVNRAQQRIRVEHKDDHDHDDRAA